MEMRCIEARVVVGVEMLMNYRIGSRPQWVSQPLRPIPKGEEMTSSTDGS